MKKSILNLGKALNRAEQKEISGGFGIVPHLCVSNQKCVTDDDCCFGESCHLIQYGYPKRCN